MPIDSSSVQHVPLLQALLLGIVQGATEFLPVSSTAHMRVIPALLGWADPGTAFSAVVQLGPIIAIIIYFRSKIALYSAGIVRSLKVGKMFPKDDVEAKLGWFVLLGTIPLVVAGLLLEKKVDTQYRNLYYVGSALILLGVILAIAEKVGKRKRAMGDLTFKEAMGIGLSQALALVPGASRSGCTITSGLFYGLTREDAADFSFLLSIPAITLAGLYKGMKVARLNGLSSALPNYLISTVVAGIVAYIVIALFLGYLKDDKHTTAPFIIYRIALGTLLIGLAVTHVLTPQSFAQNSRSRLEPASTPGAQSVEMNSKTAETPTIEASSFQLCGAIGPDRPPVKVKEDMTSMPTQIDGDLLCSQLSPFRLY